MVQQVQKKGRTAECPLCACQSKYLGDLYDDRHGFGGFFSYFICSNCGLAFHDTPLGQAIMHTLYSEYYPRSEIKDTDWQPAKFTNSFSDWLRGKSSAYMYIPENVSILDIGCGFGEALGYHQQRGCDVHGTEFDNNVQRIAVKQNLDIRCGAFSASDWHGGQFDYVTLDQVIEHNSHPLPLLREIAQVLSSKGTLVLTTPNAASANCRLFKTRWIHWHPPYHCCLYTKSSLQMLLSKAGYEVLTVQSVTPSTWLVYQLEHLLTRPGEGEKSPLWDMRSTRKLQCHTRFLLRILHLLERCKLFALLTRFFDLMGVGDNLVIHARKL